MKRHQKHAIQAISRDSGSSTTSHGGSPEDQSWAPLIELGPAYTYFPTYAQVLTEYNRSNYQPVFLVEANYDSNSFLPPMAFYAKFTKTGILDYA